MKQKAFLLFILFFLSNIAFSQPTYHRIWGVKENRKVNDSYVYYVKMFDNVVYYNDINKINTIQLPEATTETFIEIGSQETTRILFKHRSNNGDWYISGYTSETENFVTPGAFRTAFDYEQNPTPIPTNGFLAKYSEEGELQWCTYTDLILGDTPLGETIATDTENNVYFISYKTNNEVIENSPFQSTANPEDFVVGNKTTTITKLNDSGTYQWSTFFGIHFTGIRDIKSTTDGLVIIGNVMSNELFSGIPMTNNSYFGTSEAYQETSITPVQGEQISFINKFNFDGTRAWGTYFGDVKLIHTFDNEIYIEGRGFQTSEQNPENFATENTFIDEPDLVNEFQGILTRLSSDGSHIMWSTYTSNEIFGLVSPNGRIASINSDGNIWLFGQTNSTTGVATDDAYQTEKNMVTANNNDSYHLLLANDGSTILYSTYYGFEGDDASLAIFPAENGYYSVEQTNGNSNQENFITQGNLLEPDEEDGSTYGGLVYTYFSTEEPVSSSVFDKKKISIYPNPTENVLHLTGEIEDFTKIEIYNLQGQRVFQQPINASEIISVDINSLASGVYLLTISNTTDKQTYRVVKK